MGIEVLRDTLPAPCPCPERIWGPPQGFAPGPQLIWAPRGPSTRWGDVNNQDLVPGTEWGLRCPRKRKGPPVAPACRREGCRPLSPRSAAPTQRAHSLHNSAPTRPQAELQPPCAAPVRAGPLGPPPVHGRSTVLSMSSGTHVPPVPSRKERLWGLWAAFLAFLLLGEAQS